MASLRRRALLLACLAVLLGPAPPVHAAAPTASQVKAVFLFNFTHFVQWPQDASASPDTPFVIGLLGAEEELAPHLHEAVRDEKVNGRPLEVRLYRSHEEIGDCQILFIGAGHESQLDRVLGVLQGRRTLTVSDLEGSARRGAMIQLAEEKNRVRLLINVDAAQAAGLTISSNLLRPAEIVGTRR